AAVQLDDGTRDREAETGAAALTLPAPRPVELLEQLLLLRPGHADAVVLDIDAYGRVPRGDAHRNVAAGWRVLHRVGDEVREHLPDAPPVCPDRDARRLEVGAQLDAVLLGVPPMAFERVEDDL